MSIKPTIIPAILWLIMSTVLFCLPGAAFPKDDWLDKIWFDKWVHIGLISVLVFLACWGVMRYVQDEKKFRFLFIIFSVDAFVYGIIMEFVQANYIPNRSFDWGDIAADAAGALAGWCLVNWFYNSYIKK